MEYAAGGELFEYIVTKSRLDEHEACGFYHQLLFGIEYIHSQKIVHRDLKPENLLLDSYKNLKIADFGLGNAYITKNELLNTACGSPCYAAPEMIAGKRYIGLNADIWSSGIVLFAMICGYLPFEDQDTSNLYRKIIAGKYETPIHLSEEVKDLLEKVLNVDPEKRWGIEKIRGHKWMKGLKDERMIRVKEIKGVYDNDLNEKVAEMMEVKRSDLLKAIRENKHNNITATYYLLIAREVRIINEKLDRIMAANMLEPGEKSRNKTWGGKKTKLFKEDKRKFTVELDGKVPIEDILRKIASCDKEKLKEDLMGRRQERPESSIEFTERQVREKSGGNKKMSIDETDEVESPIVKREVICIEKEGKREEIQIKQEEIIGKCEEIQIKEEQIGFEENGEEIQQKSEEIQVNQEVILGKSEEIIWKEEEIQRKSEEIQVNDEVNREKSEEIVGKSEEIRGKDEEIQVKKEVLIGKTEEINRKNEEVIEKNEEVILAKEKTEEEILERNKEIIQKNEEIFRTNEEIERLNEEIERENSGKIEIKTEILEKDIKEEILEKTNENLIVEEREKTENHQPKVIFHEKKSVLFNENERIFEEKNEIITFQEEEKYVQEEEKHKNTFLDEKTIIFNERDDKNEQKVLIIEEETRNSSNNYQNVPFDKKETVVLQEKNMEVTSEIHKNIEESSEVQEKIEVFSEKFSSDDIQKNIDVSSEIHKFEFSSEIQVSVSSEIKKKIEIEKFEVSSEIQKNIELSSEVEKFEVSSEIQKNIEFSSEIQKNIEDSPEIQKNIENSSEVHENIEHSSEVHENIEDSPEIQKSIEDSLEIQKKIENSPEIHQTLFKNLSFDSIRKFSEDPVPHKKTIEFSIAHSSANDEEKTQEKFAFETPSNKGKSSLLRNEKLIVNNLIDFEEQIPEKHKKAMSIPTELQEKTKEKQHFLETRSVEINKFEENAQKIDDSNKDIRKAMKKKMEEKEIEVYEKPNEQEKTNEKENEKEEEEKMKKNEVIEEKAENVKKQEKEEIAKEKEEKNIELDKGLLEEKMGPKAKGFDGNEKEKTNKLIQQEIEDKILAKVDEKVEEEKQEKYEKLDEFQQKSKETVICNINEKKLDFNEESLTQLIELGILLSNKKIEENPLLQPERRVKPLLKSEAKEKSLLENEVKEQFLIDLEVKEKTLLEPESKQKLETQKNDIKTQKKATEETPSKDPKEEQSNKVQNPLLIQTELVKKPVKPQSLVRKLQVFSTKAQKAEIPELPEKSSSGKKKANLEINRPQNENSKRNPSAKQQNSEIGPNSSQREAKTEQITEKIIKPKSEKKLEKTAEKKPKKILEKKTEKLIEKKSEKKQEKIIEKKREKSLEKKFESPLKNPSKIPQKSCPKSVFVKNAPTKRFEKPIKEDPNDSDSKEEISPPRHPNTNPRPKPTNTSHKDHDLLELMYDILRKDKQIYKAIELSIRKESKTNQNNQPIKQLESKHKHSISLHSGQNTNRVISKKVEIKERPMSVDPRKKELLNRSCVEPQRKRPISNNRDESIERKRFESNKNPKKIIKEPILLQKKPILLQKEHKEPLNLKSFSSKSPLDLLSELNKALLDLEVPSLKVFFLSIFLKNK